MAKRCVAYGRVSTNQEKQKTSLENQRLYYEEKFKGDGYLPSPFGMLYRRNGTTEPLPSMYIDEGISGTNTKKREGFNRMIADCEAGKIDLILTKSISRFTRNAADCLILSRKLKTLPNPVGIKFETENINTLDNISHILDVAAENKSRGHS